MGRSPAQQGTALRSVLRAASPTNWLLPVVVKMTVSSAAYLTKPTSWSPASFYGSHFFREPISR